MGEEVKVSDYDNYGGGSGGSGGGDDERVMEWEVGLPTVEDLTPLSQALIPPELASAFSITPEPCRSMLDVTRASETTFSSLRGSNSQGFSSNNFKSFNEDRNRDKSSDPMVVEGDETDRDGSAPDSRKLRKVNSPEEADSAARIENSGEDPSAKTLKRPRLVWTPQLHKRFVDVVGHLGIKNAVPKTIMQMMNVEGLTRENVASHLQKYRLYLKRMQGLSNDGPTSSDQLFSSPHESGASHSNGHGPMPIPMPYGAPPGMIPMPVYGHGHMGMPVGHPGGSAGYHGFDSYNMMQQRDWSGNKYGSVVPYPPRVTPNDK